jgi:hypothetical protein
MSPNHSKALLFSPDQNDEYDPQFHDDTAVKRRVKENKKKRADDNQLEGGTQITRRAKKEKVNISSIDCTIIKKVEET